MRWITTLRPVLVLLGAAALAGPDGPLAAAEAPAASYQSEAAPRAAPRRLAQRRGLTPLVELPAAAEAARAELAALAEHNRQQLERGPAPRLRDGFTRAIAPRAVRLRLVGETPGARVAQGALVVRRETTLTWTAKVVVADAWAVRLGLSGVSLPRGSRIWVYTHDGPFLGPFGHELIGPDGVLLLPPVDGPAVFLEIEAPLATAVGGELGFVLDRVVELVELTTDQPTVWSDCDIDGTCVSTSSLPTIGDYRAGVARLSFMDGGFSYLCSGALVNDSDPSGFRPFLLTANHCFDTQASASSLVAYFDYRTATCNGSAPSLASVPQVSGATLLATNAASDFTFVELFAMPSGFRLLLGWTTATPAHGQTLYRLSHPEGTVQRFSAQTFLATGGLVCGGLPRPGFHYSAPLSGSTSGGSSGAPLVDDTLHIVGQLFGVCHLLDWDDCSYGTYNYIDGAFATTYPYVSPWLAAGAGCADDLYEPDDICFGKQIVVGGSQVHQHCDEDWIWFVGEAGATYRVETSALVGGADTTLAISASCGAQLAFDDDGGGGFASRLDVTPGVLTTYDVRIREFADAYAAGKGYTVSVTCIANCSGSSIFGHGFEPGDPPWSDVVP